VGAVEDLGEGLDGVRFAGAGGAEEEEDADGAAFGGEAGAVHLEVRNDVFEDLRLADDFGGEEFDQFVVGGGFPNTHRNLRTDGQGFGDGRRDPSGEGGQAQRRLPPDRRKERGEPNSASAPQRRGPGEARSFEGGARHEDRLHLPTLYRDRGKRKVL